MTDEPVRRLNFYIRPSPVLPDHRPLIKMAQILLVLKLSSRGGKSSLPRLQLFNWALKRSDRQLLMVAASRSSTLSVRAWGFDPALAIALRFATAEGLVSMASTGMQITTVGRAFIEDVETDDDMFSQERLFLANVGKKITETMVDAVVNTWSGES